MNKLTIFGIGIIIIVITILVITISNDLVKKPHYTEFEGKIIVENQCSENMACYGYNNHGRKIILDCSDMVMHGCFDNGNHTDYKILK